MRCRRKASERVNIHKNYGTESMGTVSMGTRVKVTRDFKKMVVRVHISFEEIFVRDPKRSSDSKTGKREKKVTI